MKGGTAPGKPVALPGVTPAVLVDAWVAPGVVELGTPRNKRTMYNLHNINHCRLAYSQYGFTGDNF